MSAPAAVIVGAVKTKFTALSSLIVCATKPPIVSSQVEDLPPEAPLAAGWTQVAISPIELTWTWKGPPTIAF